MMRFSAAVSVSICLLLAGPGSGQTPEQVNRAIDLGVDFLKATQRIDGTWDDVHDKVGGMTALATLALLSCDVPKDDAKVRKALESLRGLPPKHTYVVALQTMVFALANPKGDYALIRRNAQWLMKSRHANGMWGYGAFFGNSADNSNTQFALLGLHAAAEAGVSIPASFWDTCRRHWIAAQSSVGSWGYPAQGSSGSMTVAGIASLEITSRELDSVRQGNYKGQRVRCDGALENKPLEMAINWLSRNFSVTRNPGGNNTWHFYYLYGLERAGRLTGRRFFGDHDWYREGVRYLIKTQSGRGAWNNGNGIGRLTDTAFALLFLSKGRIPILINKLKYGRLDDWNKAPKDVNNLTNFMVKTWQTKLNWQVVDINLANVEDLLQAPVVQFSGHRAPIFGDIQKEQLRKYIEQGGYIVADANCSIPDFDAGFRNLCRELFPERDLRRLEPDHGVWSSLFDLQPNWPLYGLDVSCRTAIFYSPEDLSCNWQHKRDPNSMPAFQVGANILAYATAPENLKRKLEKRRILPESGEDEVKRGFLQVAKIRHNGDWNPAPKAIANLMSSLRSIAKIDVVRQAREIDILSPNFANYPLSYMHGRYRFVFSAGEKKRLREYLEMGGVLFADACCGSEQFDEAFRMLMREMFPKNELKLITADHELMTREIGYDLSEVQFTKALGGRRAPPVLEGIELDGRFAVIYSKYDLGCALENQQSSNCRGYIHESALQIATNIVLYALKQ